MKPRAFVRRYWPVLIVLAAALAWWPAVRYLADFRDPDVPFITTPEDVVAAMLDLAEVTEAVAAVQALGPRVVLTTSLVTDDTPDDAVDLLASEGGRHFRVRTPRLDVAVNGAGDAIAALFLAHWLDTRDAGQALGRAAASVYGLLKRTEDAGSREILLVAAQEEYVTPSRTFDVVEV